MTASFNMLPDFNPDLSPEDKRRIVEGLRKSVVAYPEVVEDLAAEVSKRAELTLLLGQFEDRLARSLNPAEKQTIAARLDTIGGRRLGRVLLSLAADDLTAWLADPNAR